MTRKCNRCGCMLSRYNSESLCASCYASHPPTYEWYLEDDAPPPAPRRARERCKRGHDLSVHGVFMNSGGGRMARRCMACRREYQTLRVRDRTTRPQSESAA